LEILIQDDGRGFEPHTPSVRDKQQGLGNMRRRAAEMGAALAMESEPGKGTRIRLTVNFPNG
jgi:two-component system nitrate/nitrite sensor histidine kinase NarX